MVWPDLACLHATDTEVGRLNLMCEEPVSVLLQILHSFIGLTEEGVENATSWTSAYWSHQDTHR